jgi:hypothetical protein
MHAAYELVAGYVRFSSSYEYEQEIAAINYTGIYV